MTGAPDDPPFAADPAPSPGAAAIVAAVEAAETVPPADAADPGTAQPAAAPRQRRSGKKKSGAKKRPKRASDDEGDEPRDRAADLVLKAVRSGSCLIRKTLSGDVLVKFEVCGVPQTWGLRSIQFRRWLRLEVRRLPGGRLVPRAAIDDALEFIEAEAHESAETCEPAVRTMIVGDELLIDLCDDSWRHLAIRTSGDFEIRQNGDIPFVRSRGALPLPVPELGEGFKKFREFINTDEDSGTLIILWMIKAMWPRGPTPILNIQGPEGSVKSSLASLVMSLVSPSIGNGLLVPPRDVEGLFVHARNRHVLAYDNLSTVSAEMSDAFSALTTGVTWAGRARFTDNEENLYFGRKPFLFTSITEVLDRADAGSRLLVAKTKFMKDEDRLSESIATANWERARPWVFGALCTALSVVLRRIDSVKLDSYGRMADFDQVAVAAAPALDLTDEQIKHILTNCRKGVMEAAFENDPVAVAIVDFMDGRFPDNPERSAEYRDQWIGSPSELFDFVTAHAAHRTRQLLSWPKSPRSFGKQVDRCRVVLRQQDFALDRPPKQDGKRVIQIVRLK